MWPPLFIDMELCSQLPPHCPGILIQSQSQSARPSVNPSPLPLQFETDKSNWRQIQWGRHRSRARNSPSNDTPNPFDYSVSFLLYCIFFSSFNYYFNVFGGVGDSSGHRSTAVHNRTSSFETGAKFNTEIHQKAKTAPRLPWNPTGNRIALQTTTTTTTIKSTFENQIKLNLQLKIFFLKMNIHQK